MFKNPKMKKILVLGVKWGTVFGLLLLIVIGGYVYTTINDLKLSLNEMTIEKSAVQQSPSILEMDSYIDKKQLLDISTFFEDTKNAHAIEDLMDVGELIEYQNQFIPTKDIYLPKTLDNQCQRFNCLQFRKSFKEIPAPIWKGLLGTEDFRFLEHEGVDPVAIARAIVVDILAMKFVQGGSTLTQQLVKNLFLTNERTLGRKFKEMIYALYIEHILSKEEIVTLYLNEMFWGTFQGVYLKGFYAASLAYFNKAPKYLTDYEATLLISLLKGPYFYRPTKNIERLKSRANAVYKRLSELDLMASKTSEIWDENKWLAFQEDFIKRNKKFNFKAYYQVSKNSESYLEPYEKFILVSSVFEIQDYLKERSKGADIGVKVLIAGRECEDFNCEDMFSYYSKPERVKMTAISQEAHQVGSLLKPIVYDSFIDLGKSYDDEVSTSPLTLKLKSGTWTPKDYSKAKAQEVTLKYALQKSKNIPLIRTAEELGFDKLEENLSKRIPKLKSPLAEFPAQLLGALELSVEEAFMTYSKFIKNKCDQIKENDEDIEDTVLYFMSNAGETTISKVASSKFKQLHIFGKTGTSNNGLDSWYYAFDGKSHFVIWFGVESNRDKYDLPISGAASSFRILQKFILNRGKLPSEVFCP